MVTISWFYATVVANGQTREQAAVQLVERAQVVVQPQVQEEARAEI